MSGSARRATATAITPSYLRQSIGLSDLKALRLSEPMMGLEGDTGVANVDINVGKFARLSLHH